MAVADDEQLLLLLDRRLDAWTRARPECARDLRRQRQLIRCGLTAPRPPVAQPFAVPREHVAARVHDGVPLLDDQPAHLDIQFAADLFARLLSVLQQNGDAEQQPRLESLLEAVTSARLDAERLFGEAFVQHADHLAELAIDGGLDVALLSSLSAHAVSPLLRAYAQRLLPMVERLDHGAPGDAIWGWGYCPVCGGWPALAESRDGDGTPWLRCRACGSGWQQHRLACPYCGCDDSDAWHSLTIDGGEQRVHVSVCERCKRYLKSVDVCEPTPPALLGLDDVATGFLDVAAVERGYRRAEGGGFRIELAVPEEDWLDEPGED